MGVIFKVGVGVGVYIFFLIAEKGTRKNKNVGLAKKVRGLDRRKKPPDQKKKSRKVSADLKKFN